MTGTLQARAPQQRISKRDFAALSVPAIGQWAPSRTVSVVVPAPRRQEGLDLLLASLCAQTYPSHLMEVVIVDGRAATPMRLGELVPMRTRIIQNAQEGQQSAHALHRGVSAADGDVILRLGANSLVAREHIEAHMRWHHVADYFAVVGSVTSIDFTDRKIDPADVPQAMSSGGAEAFLDVPASATTTEDANLLWAWAPAALANAEVAMSFSPRLYSDCEGEAESAFHDDIEFCYRLIQAGGVLVPDDEARSWHLTNSQLSADNSDEPRQREVYLRHRIPLRRDWRTDAGRQWKVPYVSVVVDASHSTHHDVSSTVAGALASSVPDVVVTIVGPWADVVDQPHQESDQGADLRLIREDFMHDGRVQWRESVATTSAPSPFRFVCPAGLVLTPEGLDRLVELADENMLGMVLLAFARGSELLIARLERTEAVARANALRGPEEDLGDVIHELFGVHWIDGSEWALATAKATSRPMSVPELRAEVDKWKKAAVQRKEEAERWRREADRMAKLAEIPGMRRIIAIAKPVIRALIAKRAADK